MMRNIKEPYLGITVLNGIETQTLVIGVTSDVLFPINEQQALAKYIPKANYSEIDSLYGHDGFLIETQQLTEKIKHFYQTQTTINQTVTL